MTPEEAYARVNFGKASAAALEALSETLEEAERAIERRVYQQLSGVLDPQQAVQAWTQKHALFVLRQKLVQHVRAGISAGRHIGEGNG